MGKEIKKGTRKSSTKKRFVQNIKELAKIVGVSISTISKSLNDHPEISDATKKRVRRYAKEYNYRPNFIASNLKSKRTKIIALVLPELSSYIFSQMLQGVEAVAEREGYLVITCLTDESHRKESNIIRGLSNGIVDGFLISVSEETLKQGKYNHLRQIDNFGFPMVLFDRMVKGFERADKVAVKHYETGFDAVQHLYEMGSRRISFVSTRFSIGKNQERYQGYLAALNHYGLPIDEDIIICNDTYDYKKHQGIVEQLFESKKGIDSVVATDESTAMAAIQVAKQRGFSVPDAFSVIGFSNGVLARHSNPRLTTMSQHAHKVGSVAAELLIKRLSSNEERNKPFVKELIPGTLIKRNSTRGN